MNVLALQRHARSSSEHATLTIIVRHEGSSSCKPGGHAPVPQATDWNRIETGCSCFRKSRANLHIFMNIEMFVEDLQVILASLPFSIGRNSAVSEVEFAAH